MLEQLTFSKQLIDLKLAYLLVNFIWITYKWAIQK